MAPKEPVVTFDGFFETSFRALKFVGWSRNQETAPKWHKLLYWAAFCNFVVSFLNVTLNLLMNLGQEGKFLEITDTATATALGSSTIVKSFMILFANHNEKLSLLNMFEEYLRESEAKVSKDEINHTMQKFKVFWRGFSVLNIFFIAVFSLNFVVLMLYSLITQTDFKYQTPFIGFYPFEDSWNITSIFVFLHQICAQCTALLLVVGCDSMFSAMALIMCLKFSELKQEIRMAKTAQELKHCIVAHVDLIEMSEKLSSMYQPLIFYEFLTASVTICLVGFQSMVT